MPNIKGGPELALGSLLSSLKTPAPYAVHSQVTQGSRLDRTEYLSASASVHSRESRPDSGILAGIGYEIKLV